MNKELIFKSFIKELTNFALFFFLKHEKENKNVSSEALFYIFLLSFIFLIYIFIKDFKINFFILYFYIALSLYLLISNTPYFIRHFKKLDLNFLNLDSLYKLMTDKDIFLGYGFEFNHIHRQRYENEIKNVDLNGNKSIIGDDRLQRLSFFNQNKISFDVSHTNGHSIIFGTTGTGKTKLLINLISQAILRNETVIILDPKNDKDLYNACISACHLINRDDDFYELKLSTQNDKNTSLNLFNLDKSPLDIANAIASMCDNASQDNFLEYSKNAVLACASALSLNNESITLRSIRNNILNLDYFQESLYLYFRHLVVTLKDNDAFIYFKRLHGENVKVQDIEFKENAFSKTKGLKIKKELLKGFYEYLVLKNLIKLNASIESLFTVIDYDKGYYTKVASSFIPKLNILCDDMLLNVLDDNPKNVSLPYLCNNNKVFYIGLNFLQNSLKAESFGKLILSELCSIAGKRYDNDIKTPRINLFVDEVSELIFDPLIQLLNKSRGANMAITLATQTIKDLSKNKESMALRVVGNCNTLISLRLRDEATQKLIESSFKKTYLKQITSNQTLSKTKDGMSFSLSKKVNLEKDSIFPTEALLSMSNFHFIAYLADGRFIKGMIPFVRV